MEIDEIYLGDSYELIKKLPDKSVDLIVTDPPYLIKSTRGGGIAKQGSIKQALQELSDVKIVHGIDNSILDEFMRVMKAPNIYIWCNKKQFRQYLDYFLDKGCSFDLIVWQKPNAAPLCGGKYMNDCEYCLYFRKGVKLNTRYETAKTVYVKPLNQADKKLYGHPTIKPLDIIETMIQNSSVERGVVLDPFIGSGTTAAAAKGLNRHFIGFEINPEYHKVACDRLKGITRKEAQSGFVQSTLF